MDEDQKNHLKAYGIAYWTIKNQLEVDWLLNYRGGSFLIKYAKSVEDECKIRGVSYEILADGKVTSILNEINKPDVNMEMVKLEKAPKIAVYSPKSKLPWDDAVTLVLTYAEIPYEVIYDDDILKDKLVAYDWLHLHHEDFTGQYGRFWAAYQNVKWYQDDVKYQEEAAKRNGFKKVSEMKLAVAKRIKEYCAGGGFLFAMCSGTDSFDIALAAEGVDIADRMFDGDGVDPQAQSKLDFSKTFAFTDFRLDMNPYNYEFADIDVTQTRNFNVTNDFFTLFDFSAKWDLVPTMLTQNHERVIKGFMGQTTAFRKRLVKPSVTVMGENKAGEEVRYLHGETGKGQFTFYGGHDPEDYQHQVGDPPTDLSLHPNSPGYRLILNNVLFPAAKKKPQKT
ncbi:asparagine synthetase B [Pedobacter montanisoli]|uniref:Asparagine synthetase B n=1 Tax=Pedobacter montanisoli TaxID=2923277 RepID=A0ABS9ZWF9_9SPHI|nr:asparagine synthetase B [Pedobacter montanisoli]MCJ0742637.1 asparagine synthetase B [Pedobacter montanisoli]